MEMYQNVTRFCADCLPQLPLKEKAGRCLARFSVKKSTIMIKQQHHAIAVKGSGAFLQRIKEPLADFVTDIMKLLQTLTGRKSGKWRNLPSAESLLALDEKVFIAQCRLVYHTANRMLVTYEHNGLNLQTVNTLKTAIDVYDAVVPAPKAAKSLEQAYENALDILFKEADDLLRNELDPAMLEAAAGRPGILLNYKAIRKLKN